MIEAEAEEDSDEEEEDDEDEEEGSDEDEEDGEDEEELERFRMCLVTPYLKYKLWFCYLLLM